MKKGARDRERLRESEFLSHPKQTICVRRQLGEIYFSICSKLSNEFHPSSSVRLLRGCHAHSGGQAAVSVLAEITKDT